MGDENLSPSELGTKEYWDQFYTEEYENFNNHGDCGEIWFGENIMRRILRWFHHKGGKLDKQTTAIVDLGCGNGILLHELSKDGYQNLVGVDYSVAAIQLAYKIAAETPQCGSIQFQVGDILNMQEDSRCIAFNRKYHICTDKGTYDAISLDPDNALDKQKRYVQNVSQILLASGLLVLTSCNWTKEELANQFKEEFTVLEEIAMPQFIFGGKTGQKVTSVILQKKTQSQTD